MTFVVFSMMVVFMTGMAVVALTPSPYFAALGLVMVSGMGCGILLWYGAPFLSLVLFLIYLGGMLVVFAYSTALAAEPFPELWGGGSVMSSMFLCMSVVVFLSSFFWEGWSGVFWGGVNELEDFLLLRGDAGGIGEMYSLGGGLLIISVWVLLLALFAVLEMTRGLSRGALRAV
uniref:NADH-ubiquinone oxidoreductase chain 6 n=1 Tax=Coryphaena hippurus TaxID=34814 RepID=T2HT28_CORHP|nr:NADH dehydrogenase subunit 6 [Coryphaena hippurus]